MTLPNGVMTSYGYDDADRLLSVDHDLGMTPIASVAYTLNAVGNRTQRVDDLGTHTYTYDDLHRLTEVTYPGPSTTSYVFDAFGNRTELTDASGTTTYAYDDAERLTTVTPPSPASPISYTWDDNGNLTDRGTDTFTWDYEDRLVEAEVDSVVTTFEYRGDGLPDSATVGMNTTTYTWDIAAGLPVVLQENDIRYVWGAHGLIAQVDATPDWHYYHADGLGSTLAITEDMGAIEQTYEYDVYGAVTGGSGSLDNGFQFAGEQVDAATGLQYLRARYYDMATGRFISRDPLAARPGWSASGYSYGAARPTDLTDPEGMCVWRLPCPKPPNPLNGVWYALRAELNSELSAAALAGGIQGGGDCRHRKHGIIVCYGMSKGIPDGRSAMTIGNVVWTTREYENFDDRLFNHEERHADQWALAGLACDLNPLAHMPFVGSGIKVTCQSLVGAGAYALVGDLLETFANKEDGCYTRPRREGC